MVSEIDDLTVNYEENDVLLVKELDKKVLTRGAWSTIMFKYQDWNAEDGKYGPDKYTIRRYQKQHGEYKQRSKFNISNKDQAQQIIEVLQAWI